LEDRLSAGASRHSIALIAMIRKAWKIAHRLDKQFISFEESIEAIPIFKTMFLRHMFEEFKPIYNHRR
jgi:hypothetical protein